MCKNIIVLLSLFIILCTGFIRPQNAIIDCDSIPLVSYIYSLDQFGTNYQILSRIDTLRFNSVEILNLNDSYYNRYNISEHNFKIIPDQVNELLVGPGKNLINKYTEAKYSVWQAESTPPEDGEATLVRNQTHTNSTGNYVYTKNQNIPNGTELITGPSYWQDATYNTVDKGDTVDYLADFCMKLEEPIPGVMQSGDLVCNLQVTTCIYDVVNGAWAKTDSFIIAEAPVIRGSFPQLNQWEHFQFQYNLAGLPDYYFNNYSRPSESPNPPHWGNDSRNHVQHIEFKVIWKGNAQAVKLSIDSITISDERGRQLTEDWQITKQSILDMIDYQYQFKNKISGWFGLDEPHSIDNFEPIRIISELLESQPNAAKLWISLEGSWSGCWGNPGHGLSAGERINKVDEFFKRVKRANVLQNIGAVEWPWTWNTIPPPTYDPRLMNIDLNAESFYAHFNNYPSANWGSSVLASKVPSLGYPEVNRNEMLYQANLALLYGAKILAPWLIFGSPKDPSKDCTGMINQDESGNFEYTDKYYTMRDTIAPRLGGLFGKTIKRLTPIEQYAGSNGITHHQISPTLIPFSGYLYLEDIYSTEIIPSDIEYGLDMGFFSDPVASYKQYFMILNRYYSQVNKYTIKLRQLSGFNNWNLSNYVDTTNITLIALNTIATFQDTILKGDANLYSISPVVKSGGRLIVNETVVDGTTLYSDLAIESGATLTVNGTYNAKANITVKNGGKIIAGTNGKIIFDPGKKLIVEGTTEIKGTSPINKLTLEFVSSEKGIDVLPGSSLALSYCSITGAYYGLVTRTGTPSYLNITYSNFAFGSTGIVLNGNFYGEGSSPSPTSTISNCVFTTWGTGISVSNNSSVIISQNNFTSCGISILNVPAAYIQSNSIYSGSNQSYSGIFFNNSGGYIRNNLVKNRVNGIHLANSSPDVGGNVLENNYLHGLYIGTGSIPNLVGLVQTNPPTYFALAGYNTIFNNGNNTQVNTENDGSEIYLSSANISLRDGCNEIVDDRQNPPNTGTILLVNGSLAVGGGRQLDARNNYWGTITPTSSRFGSLTVLFTPYYGSPCPIPDGGSGGEESFVLSTPNDEVIDTIRSAEGTPEELTALEASYSEADKLFATGNAEQSKTIYEQIVNSSYTAEEK
jgi:hypothetical protein